MCIKTFATNVIIKINTITAMDISPNIKSEWSTNLHISYQILCYDKLIFTNTKWYSNIKVIKDILPCFAVIRNYIEYLSIECECIVGLN